MPVTRDMLLSELKELQRLTAFEQTVATVRRAQAATAPIAEELAANAAKAGERLGLLAQAVRGAGGTPDLVGPVLGKLGAFAQTQLNQVQTLQGALLGDLALEHQLRERARYARSLAVTLGEISIVPVLDRLDSAHTETISWLERRLAEVARTGSSAVQPTPVQAAVGSLRKVWLAPLSLTGEAVNRVGALALKLARRTPATLSTVEGTVDSAVRSTVDTASATATAVAGTVSTAVGEAADVASELASSAAVTASRAAETASDAVDSATDTVESAVDGAARSAAGTVERVADTAAQVVDSTAGTVAEAVDSGADRAADAVGSAADTVTDTVQATDTAATAGSETAEDVTERVLDLTGGADVPDEKAPFAAYERLTGDSIIRHVDDTEDVEELRTLLAFEQAHKARKGVLKAAQARLESLASSV